MGYDERFFFYLCFNAKFGSIREQLVKEYSKYVKKVGRCPPSVDYAYVVISQFTIHLGHLSFKNYNIGPDGEIRVGNIIPRGRLRTFITDLRDFYHTVSIKTLTFGQEKTEMYDMLHALFPELVPEWDPITRVFYNLSLPPFSTTAAAASGGLEETDFLVAGALEETDSSVTSSASANGVDVAKPVVSWGRLHWASGTKPQDVEVLSKYLDMYEDQSHEGSATWVHLRRDEWGHTTYETDVDDKPRMVIMRETSWLDDDSPPSCTPYACELSRSFLYLSPAGVDTLIGTHVDFDTLCTDEVVPFLDGIIIPHVCFDQYDYLRKRCLRTELRTIVPSGCDISMFKCVYEINVDMVSGRVVKEWCLPIVSDEQVD